MKWETGDHPLGEVGGEFVGLYAVSAHLEGLEESFRMSFLWRSESCLGNQYPNGEIGESFKVGVHIILCRSSTK